MARSSSYCYKDFDEIDEKAAKKHLRPVILDPLTDIYKRFENIKDWTLKNIDTAINETVDKFKINMGKLGQPIRVSITGSTMSPSINITIKLIGKERVLKRLEKVNKIKNKDIRQINIILNVVKYNTLYKQNLFLNFLRVH